MKADSIEIGERKFVREKEKEKDAPDSRSEVKREEEHVPHRKERKKQREKEERKEERTEEKKEDGKKEEKKGIDEDARNLKAKEEKTKHRRVERKGFLQAAADSMEAGISHDMRDQALGMMSSVSGARVDYDELRRMSNNGIRDAGELRDESLGNHGFETNVERIQKMMEGYVHEGKPDINEIAGLEKQYDVGEIAQAYVNTAMNSNARDIRYLERIDDVLGFDRPFYEREFDSIRRYDRDADAVLDRLETEFGKERE